jgi:hypothetical protein
MFTNEDESLIKAYRCLYIVMVVSIKKSIILNKHILHVVVFFKHKNYSIIMEFTAPQG